MVERFFLPCYFVLIFQTEKQHSIAGEFERVTSVRDFLSSVASRSTSVDLDPSTTNRIPDAEGRRWIDEDF